MANYLITGGAGFIGSNIVEHLLNQGEAVRVLDNYLTGRRVNLAPFAGKIEVIEGDIRDPETCARAVEDMDYVLHQAGLNSVPRSIDNPVETCDVNMIGTARILHAAVKAKVKRFVNAGSSSVYGDQAATVKNESLLPRPISPYGASKLAAEQLCLSFGNAFGLETISLRYFNVFGPRQDPTSQYSAVMPRFITAMLAGKAPTVYGDGLQSRDFTYVENVVRANILAAHANKEATGRAMNVACGQACSLLDIIDTINSIDGTKIKPDFAPARVGDVKHSLADISLAKQHLGYQVSVELKEGLRRTVESYRSRKS